MPEAAALPTNAPQLRQASAADGAVRIELYGAWNLAALEQRVGELKPQLTASARDARGHWDLSAVTVLDHAGALLLWRAWGGKRAPQLSLRPEHEALFEHLALVPDRPAPPESGDRAAPLVGLGRGVLALVEHLAGIVQLLGQLLLDVANLARHPSRIPWREISATLYRTGAQALAITALVGFLIGVTLSYLSARQLQLFGADVYIVNILGIAILRELGPMLAAILVAGRSGSSMTAQLGVMRVTQELDALAVMGISPTRRLILPKVVALGIALPLLVLWTNAIALVGGMLAAQIQLEIDYRFFLSRLPDVVPLANFWLGIGKGAVFGVLIALIACHFGLRIRPNTESLGAGATASVVAAITVVIVVDAIFAVIFSGIGLTR